MANELAGKVTIVTGGAAGIGRATVQLFAEEGAKVVIADVDEKLGTELAASLGNKGVRFKKTDVSKREDVQAMVDFAVSEFGGLHAIVNNAGISDNHYGRLLDDDFGRFDKVMHVDVLGVFLGTQIAARHMRANGGGAIVNISSIAGTHPSYGLSTYRAAKAGVINFTKSAAIDLGEYLVRVNCICPGNIPTDMAAYSHAANGMTQADTDKMNSEIRAVRMKRQALKRQGWPIDIANAALFLASDRSPQVTGQILAVDSGTSAGDTQNLIEEIMAVRNQAMKK